MTGPDARAGAMRVRFVNGASEVVSNDALSTVDMDRLYARVIGTVEGRYCARVEGVDRAQGPYQLIVTRSGDMGGMCGLDIAESGSKKRPREHADPIGCRGQ